MKRTLVTGATALALLSGSVVTAAQAQAAVSLASVALSPSGYAAGSALETGARYTLVAPYDPATTGLVGAPITTTTGKLELSGVSAVESYRVEWLRCGARGAAAATCAVVGNSGRLSGTPNLKTFPFVPTSTELGGYIRARVTTYDLGGATNGSFESPGASDVLIVPPLATGSRPTLAQTITPGADTQVSLGAWALASGTAFSSRLIQAFTCPAADAGQTPGALLAVTGCTAVPAAYVKTPVNTAGASVVTIGVPADTNGATLVVQDTLLTKSSNGSTFGYQVRSAAGAIGVTATPTPTPSPTASAAATAVPGPTVPIPVNPSAYLSTTLRVSAPAVVKRGTKAKVVVSYGAIATGEAKVAMRSRPNAKGRANTRTVTADVVGGSASVTVTIPRTARKGTQYWYVVYVDDQTGQRSVAAKKVTVR